MLTAILIKKVRGFQNLLDKNVIDISDCILLCKGINSTFFPIRYLLPLKVSRSYAVLRVVVEHLS